MEVVATLKELIRTGEALLPEGGTKTSGYTSSLQPDYVSWRLQAISAIEELGDAAKPLLKELDSDKYGSYFYRDSASRVLGALKGALAILERRPTTPAKPQGGAAQSFDVFLVHGHDQTLLSQVARFLEKLHLNAIVLSEQPVKNQTLIEKLEAYGSVAYAVVLLTPDDAGKAAKDEKLQPRARQNVVLELGFFIGRLGRPNVTILYDESVELPSDYTGMDYIKIDAEGAWRLRLAQTLKASGLPVDLNDVMM